MSFELTYNCYGKARVRLTKVVRNADVHELFEIDAKVMLEGDFAAAYADGDNRNVIATDTIKNTVYVVAKENAFTSIEQFAILLCKHFVKTYPQAAGAKVELAQTAWQRINVDGKPHDHAFTIAGPQMRTCVAVLDRSGLEPGIRGGVRDLTVLKTTASAWKDFHSDRYRTLKDTSDRIFATKVNATWSYRSGEVDFNAASYAIWGAILKTFATTHSLGAQQTSKNMGDDALDACADIDEITIELPNLHRIPFNLEPFGLKFENDIFVATDEPHGVIVGTIKRRAT
jgi:urate oxidase